SRRFQPAGWRRTSRPGSARASAARARRATKRSVPSMATRSKAKGPKVVTHHKGLTARRAFLKKEKEFPRLRDELNEARRALPWEKVTKNYKFDTADGVRTLADLFEGRSQLVVYHAMFNPKAAGPKTSWTKDAACMGCSFWADNFNGVI